MPDGQTLGGKTITVPLDDGTEAALAALSEKVRRSPDELAAEAITDYVAREARIVSMIEEGIADIEARRVVPHEEVMREMWEMIEGKRAQR